MCNRRKRLRALLTYTPFLLGCKYSVVAEQWVVSPHSLGVPDPKMQLDSRDLSSVYETLYPVRAKYVIIGVFLGLGTSVLEKIRAEAYDSGEALLNVLSYRLKQFPFLTWNDIITALRAQAIGEYSLAKKIEKFVLPGPDAKDSGMFLSEAMKAGYVYVKLAKVVVVGPAGVGKTCLLYLLLSKSPPEERTSTGCAERAIRVVRISTTGGEWGEIPASEFEQMIAEAVPLLYEQLQAKVNDEKLVSLDNILTEVIEKQGGTEGDGGKVRDNVGSGCGSSSSSKQDSKSVIDGVIAKLTKLVESSQQSRRLLDMELIYLTDCGGQQAYWDLVPVFTYDTSATLFVHRLCERLDEHPLNDLYQQGKQVGPSQRATLTTSEAFKTMVRSLQESHQRSKVIVVGTHKDYADQCDETLAQKNSGFATITSPHFDDDIVYCNDIMEDIIFQVNTKCPETEDKKNVDKIREHIKKSAKEHEIPIWWFILQLILEALSRKLERDVLSKDECLQVSDSLGFSKEELDEALTFFDKLNIFLYKKAILPEVVFTNAQVPLDKLSKLVEKQYHLRASLADPTQASDTAMTGDWQKFRDRGILTIDFLREFKEHYVEGIFTPRHFLRLLEKLLVVSRLSPSDEFFLPAILNMTSKSQVTARLKSAELTPLMIQFPTGWAPPGVYCCSVCHLQSVSRWEVVKKPPIKPRNKGAAVSPVYSVSRNSIEFSKFDRPGSVTFIDNFFCFAVCVHIDTSKIGGVMLADLCKAINADIFSAIRAALETTHHADIDPKVAFLCPQQDLVSDKELHLAHLTPNHQHWVCSKNTGVFDSVTPNQKLWLSSDGSTGSSPGAEPLMSDLANHVAHEIPDKWMRVAIQLELDGGEIRAIEEDRAQAFDRFMAVMDKWKSTLRKPFTWNTLIIALRSRSVDGIKLASKLCREFC